MNCFVLHIRNRSIYREHRQQNYVLRKNVVFIALFKTYVSMVIDERNDNIVNNECVIKEHNDSNVPSLHVKIKTTLEINVAQRDTTIHKIHQNDEIT